MRPNTLATLAVAGVLLLTGCAGVGNPGTATPTDSPTPTAPVSTHLSTTPPTTTDGYYRSYEVSAQRTSPDEIVRAIALSRDEMAAELAWRTDRFVTPLFANGTAVRIVVSSEPDPHPGPFENGTLVRQNGTVYALERAVIGRRAATGYRMRLEGPLPPDHPAYDRAEREAVGFETLSSADRGVFTYAAPAPGERERGFTTAGYTYVFPDGTDSATATLVDGDRHYVRYGGELYLIRARERVDGAVRYRVEYERERVAGSASAFFEQRRESLVTPLTAETADPVVYELATGAIGGNTTEWAGDGPAPTRFRETEDWVRNQPPEGRSAYVRYEGDLYELRVEKLVE